MKKIGILGHFAINTNLCDGQTVKTRALQDALKEYVDCEIIIADTYNWKKNPTKLIWQIKNLFKNCDDIIMLPAHNGLKIFSGLLVFFNKYYHKHLYYDVIGGWLVNYVDNKKIFKNLIKFDGIFVETKQMYFSLKDYFKNIYILPNFKDLQKQIVNKQKIYQDNIKKFCIFSRVTKQKGISDAINSIVNLQKRYNICLDIYGPIDENYKEEFENLLKSSNGTVCYKGCIDSIKSVETLVNYYGLLFPTLFKTEGVPGTIIDAFFAGVPVVSSKWNSYYDILDEQVSVGYEFGKNDLLEVSIEKLLNLNEKEYLIMTNNCYDRSDFYSSKYQILELEKILLSKK